MGTIQKYLPLLAATSDRVPCVYVENERSNTGLAIC